MTLAAQERNPLMIADEINAINRRTGSTVLANALEIGRRLKEAKALVEHGKWGKWVKESVRYSQRSAGRLIRLYEGYGASPDPGSAPNWPALSNLTYTNALILLDVPAARRSDFIAGNDAEAMSSRELKRAVTAAKAGGNGAPPAAKTAAPAKPAGTDPLQEKIDGLERLLISVMDNLDGLTRRVRELEQQVENLAAVSRTEQPDDAPTALSGQPSGKIAPSDNPSGEMVANDEGPEPAASPPRVPSFIISGFENADPEYYTRQAETLFEFHRASIHRSFDQLKLLLTALSTKDKEKKERLRRQLKSFLENMANLISQWPPPVKMT